VNNYKGKNILEVMAVEIIKVLSVLEKTHQPTMLEMLKDYTPFQRLVATLLSARTKDVTVIPVVKDLFQKYPGPKEILKLSDAELEKKLYRIGFYKVKTKHVKELCRILLEKFDGKVPDTLEEMTTLPGVGRKTANCMLSYVFNKPAIAVDVHVHRISNRLGWISTKTPEESEERLMAIVPRDSWNKVNMLLVDHGQRICLPINPKCKECPVLKYCEFGKRRFTSSRSHIA